MAGIPSINQPLEKKDVTRPSMGQTKDPALGRPKRNGGAFFGGLWRASAPSGAIALRGYFAESMGEVDTVATRAIQGVSNGLPHTTYRLPDRAPLARDFGCCPRAQTRSHDRHLRHTLLANVATFTPPCVTSILIYPSMTSKCHIDLRKRLR